MSIIKNLHAQGLTNQQISEILNIKINSVRTALNRIGLKSNRFEKINADNNLKQFVIGSLLGDGCISITQKDHYNNCISFGHSLKQYDYLIWKSEFLKRYNLSSGKITTSTQVSNRYKLGFCTSYYFKSKRHPVFSEYRDVFYLNGKKILPVDLIKQMDAFALAIWYMDDGNVCTRSYQISTNNFTVEECYQLIDILKTNFDINATVDLNKRLYIRTDSKQKFENLIKPYIIPCMSYKLRTVLDKFGELSGNPEVDNTDPSQT